MLRKVLFVWRDNFLTVLLIALLIPSIQQRNYSPALRGDKNILLLAISLSYVNVP